MPITISPLKGVNTNDRRMVVFLVNSEIKFINAFDTYENNEERDQQNLQYSATLFVDRLPQSKRHHGWDQTQKNGRYVACYVLKTPNDGRYYGHLCHPSTSNSRLQVLVLVHFALKEGADTNFTLLDKVIEIMETATVAKALAELFNPKGKSK